MDILKNALRFKSSIKFTETVIRILNKVKSGTPASGGALAPSGSAARKCLTDSSFPRPHRAPILTSPPPWLSRSYRASPQAGGELVNLHQGIGILQGSLCGGRRRAPREPRRQQGIR